MKDAYRVRESDGGARQVLTTLDADGSRAGVVNKWLATPSLARKEGIWTEYKKRRHLNEAFEEGTASGRNVRRKPHKASEERQRFAKFQKKDDI
ncbi:unnamed protein product [Haemonchus placei]|uniref:Nucleolar protein 16 n=1 Tax=Haemonchus placei TaxID=6290 RepID=A0A0N4W5B5_HAEPC|nr:unnamed protein product [Haemonchus placei]